MKVLLVVAEDRATECATEFRRHDWDVSRAEDVPTGMLVARRDEPDAIVVGNRLPGGDPKALVARLRGMVATALTPIVAIAADEAAADALRAAGADVCLSPEPDLAEVHASVERAVRGEVAPPLTAPAALLADQQRIAAVEATGVEPGKPDGWFDTMARAAADLVSADICMVSLVSQKEQYFPGFSSGAGEPPTRRVPLSHSFCQWAVTDGEPVVVADAEQHPLLRHNAAVRDLQYRAYAGVPVLAGEAKLGTVCAIDARPRHWGEADVHVLRRFAAIAEAEIVLRLSALRTPSSTMPPDVLGAVRRGIVQTSRLLVDARPGPDTAAYDGLLAMLAWFSERLPHPDPSTD